MKSDTITLLDSMFVESSIMRAKDVPSVDEVDAASLQIGVPFPSDYRGFILRYGGAIVGVYPIFGLRSCEVMEDDRWSVVTITYDYRDDLRSAGVDCATEWVVFSEDHSGNPVGMDRDGKVWIYDHDFDGLTELASSFEEYTRTHCLKLSM
tara:strand:+ start:14157 stop:14609 length:453 start_codon:yes stop_codon:yes gene_type:complete